MKATLLKRLDALVGPLLTRLLWKRRAAHSAAPPRSVLFIRPGGIGDAILLVPALRALQQSHPGCQIDILAEKRNAAAFSLCPGIRTVYRYDSPSELALLLRGRYDVVVDSEQWYRLSAVIARLVRAPRSIGFAGNERGRLFTDPVPYPLQEYEASSFFNLLAPLKVQVPKEIAAPFLDLPAEAAEGARRLLAPLAGKPFVALFPGASVPEKEWGVERFRETATLLAKAGLSLVIVGGEDTRLTGDRIAEGGLALNLAGKGTLMESAALVGLAKVLLSGDSGLLHMAAGLATPTVSIFGPSDPVKWAPRGESHRVFATTRPCAPCSRFGTVPGCSVAGGCLDATPAQVADAVLVLWGGKEGEGDLL